MADTVESSEVVNVEENIKEKEVAVEEAETTEKSSESEEKSTGEQNGSGSNEETKENGTSKEENGAVSESGDERKRKSIVDVGDSNDAAEVTPDKKAKLEEKSEGKPEEVVDSPAEQIAA